MTYMLATILSANADNFGKALIILLEGMAGIFVFMALFYALIIGLERVFRERSADE